VNDVRFALLKEYAKTLRHSDRGASRQFHQALAALDQDTTELWLKYPEFEKVISHKKTAMFFQIDRRVSRLLEAGLASPTCKTIGGVFTRFCGKR
jgi:hypothetical protein